MRAILVLALAGCTTGHDLSPSETFSLAEDADLVPEAPPTYVALTGPEFATVRSGFELAVTGAEPEERVFLLNAASPGEGPCPSQLGGYCIELSRPLGFAGAAVTDGEGRVLFEETAPPFAGASSCYQAVIMRGIAGIYSALSDVVCVDFCADADADSDGICDEFDVCTGAAEVDTDGDGICDDIDTCPGGPDEFDADDDGVCDTLDVCIGASEVDTDGDGICDELDTCPGGVDGVDSDGDGVCDTLDVCPGGDDLVDSNGDGVPDDCEGGDCDEATEVELDGVCYYIDGSGGACDPGYTLAPQSDFGRMPADAFVGKNYKNRVSSNCCIWHRDQDSERQDYGMNANCNSAGPFSEGPVPGGAGCTDALNLDANQLTFCMST